MRNLTPNFWFRLGYFKRRIVILCNDWDHSSWDKKASKFRKLFDPESLAGMMNIIFVIPIPTFE